ncbi:MAG: ribonuclease HIII [candidate division Zixibacteria bacterium]|nr:ribonuclease HIII [candidate division Zixibacteria bacterium]
MLEKGNDGILEELINFTNSGIDIQPRIGIDEAGKGDYFGPLVIAAVGVDKECEIRLRSIGVADSKNITDKGIKELEQKIKKICPYSVVPIGPKKYNELYESIRNLNKLLAWGHARALENILDKYDYPSAISDKFSSKDTLKRALLEKGKKIKLIEKVRAEADTAVAAASILARAEFLDRLRKLSKLSGVTLPKGCSGEVVAAGKSLLEKFGEGSIPNYVKLHFKTTQKVLE